MRIFLFILMQVALLLIVGVIGSFIFSLLGLSPEDQNISVLLLSSALFGFTGSLISLFLSKTMCVKAYGVRLITKPATKDEQFLYRTVSNLASRSGLSLPEIGIYSSPDPNAFATGYSQNHALVAVSTGLLNSMTEDEVTAVLGHELSHVKNGDMVTMTLLQGLLNTFVYFLSYVIAAAACAAMNGKSRSRSSAAVSNLSMLRIVRPVLQALLGFLASMILMWFSRYREYRADEGSARLYGKQSMINALRALGRRPAPNFDESKQSFQSLCINGPAVMSELFMSHPPLEKRIKALEDLQL